MRIWSSPTRYERVALFGGIYSNHLALAAALADAADRGAEALFCLGDLGAFGPHPDKVFPLLEERGAIVMQGNYDASLGSGRDDCQCGYTDPRDNHFARLSYQYTFRNTSAANRAWLGTLPGALRFRVGRHLVHCCHGSPRLINEFLWESATPDALLRRFLDQTAADVLCCTHTGIKWERRLPDRRLAVNVGAIGRPENDGNTHVWYALLTAGWEVGVEFIPVRYDHEALAAEMEGEGLPGEFVETIRTGWWTTCLESLPAKERARGRF
jgi:diadenosine tetraphosphatase ApaH/serine/threonine PP2A family protein phosphatase